MQHGGRCDALGVPPVQRMGDIIDHGQVQRHPHAGQHGQMHTGFMAEVHGDAVIGPRQEQPVIRSQELVAQCIHSILHPVQVNRPGEECVWHVEITISQSVKPGPCLLSVLVRSGCRSWEAYRAGYRPPPRVEMITRRFTCFRAGRERDSPASVRLRGLTKQSKGHTPFCTQIRFRTSGEYNRSPGGVKQPATGSSGGITTGEPGVVLTPPAFCRSPHTL